MAPATVGANEAWIAGQARNDMSVWGGVPQVLSCRARPGIHVAPATVGANEAWIAGRARNDTSVWGIAPQVCHAGLDEPAPDLIRGHPCGAGNGWGQRGMDCGSSPQ